MNQSGIVPSCVKKGCQNNTGIGDLLFCWDHREEWRFMCNHPIDENDVLKIKEGLRILEKIRDERLSLARGV